MIKYLSFKKKVQKLEKLIIDCYTQAETAANPAYHTGIANGLQLARAIMLDLKEVPMAKIPEVNNDRATTAEDTREPTTGTAS